VTLPESVVTIPIGGSIGSFGVFADDLHGTFGLGAPEGAAALSVTGGFTGGDGGASSGGSTITQENVNTILAGCGAGCGSATGLKQINIGVAGITLG
jgi:hypothetical protein